MNNSRRENNPSSTELLTNKKAIELPTTRRMTRIKDMLESKRQGDKNVEDLEDTLPALNCKIDEINPVSNTELDEASLVVRLPHLKLQAEIKNAHKGRIECALFLEEHQLICTGSVDKTIKVWNSSTLELIATLFGHKDWVRRLIRLSKDQIASCSNDFTIKVWDLQTMRLSHTLKGHSSFVLRITLLSNDFLLSSSLDQKIMIWKRDNSNKYQQNSTYTSTKQLECYTIFEVSACSESDTMLIAAGSDRKINLYYGKETNSVFQLTRDSSFWGQHYIVTDIQALGPNKQFLISCCMLTIKLWSISHKRCLRTLRHSYMITGILTMSSEIFITPCDEIIIWSIYTGKSFTTTERKERDCIQTMIKLNGDKLLVAGQGKKLEIWKY
jgi:WD40 repeat protein